MTVKGSLDETTGVPRDEAELLLAFALKKPREFVLAHHDAVVPAAAGRRFRGLINRRRRHEPVAYLTGQKWFYGRPFIVTNDVLIPRPASETMVEAVLAEVPSAKFQVPTTVLDVGCGSGAIGLTLAAELPSSRVICVDVSPKALAVTRRNARRLGVLNRTRFIRLDILKKTSLGILFGRKGFPVTEKTVIVANLPYLKEGAWKRLAPGIVKFEPRLALTSGRDGLRHYRALMRRLGEWKLAPDLLALETDQPQMTALKRIVRNVLPKYRIRVIKDLGGQDRVLIARNRK